MEFDVYADLPNTFVMFGEATVTTTISPTQVIEPLELMSERIKRLEQRALEASFLINASFMAQHPVAMLTLAVAAVEMLSADEQWNVKSKEVDQVPSPVPSEFGRSG